MGQKRPSQHKEGKVLQTKKKKIVESYINTSPTDHSALNMVFTLNKKPKTSTCTVQEGSFLLSLLKRCYRCKGVLKLRH
ncbi:hypothetical protein pdam_00022175, partial [Pocillopora damicornis]